MAGQGHTEINDHLTSAHTLARRSLTSWPSDFKSGFRDAKFNNTQEYVNQNIMYDDRSWRRKALTYNDNRFNELRQSHTPGNYDGSIGKLGSKTYSALTKFASTPKGANYVTASTEQPKPNNSNPNPEPETANDTSQPGPQQQQQSTAADNTN
ncbi:hypothetical protein H4R33_006880, partial [Dimargaris cristalligena]